MPIEHVVFLRLAADMSTDDFQKLKAQFMALKDQVPNILELSIGCNITSGRDLGYTHALRVLFPDEASMKAYAVHPKHQEFVKVLSFDKSRTDLPPSACIDWIRE